MPRKPKQVPLTPEEAMALTQPQLLRRANDNARYWLNKSDAIQKLSSPSARQLEAQPWYEQHGLIWLKYAETITDLQAHADWLQSALITALPAGDLEPDLASTHAVQVAKIIEAGLAGDVARLKGYAGLIASDLQAAGQDRQARIIARAYGALPPGPACTLDTAAPYSVPSCSRCNYIATAPDATTCPICRGQLSDRVERPRPYKPNE